VESPTHGIMALAASMGSYTSALGVRQVWGRMHVQSSVEEPILLVSSEHQYVVNLVGVLS
jgi:hypothetical protein